MTIFIKWKKPWENGHSLFLPLIGLHSWLNEHQQEVGQHGNYSSEIIYNNKRQNTLKLNLNTDNKPSKPCTYFWYCNANIKIINKRINLLIVLVWVTSNAKTAGPVINIGPLIVTLIKNITTNIVRVSIWNIIVC